jgi:hypothetical protein
MQMGLVLIIDGIHFRFLMEIIINACGIFKVRLKLVQTTKHDLHYGQYSQCFSVLQNKSNKMHFNFFSHGI